VGPAAGLLGAAPAAAGAPQRQFFRYLLTGEPSWNLPDFFLHNFHRTIAPRVPTKVPAVAGGNQRPFPRALSLASGEPPMGEHSSFLPSLLRINWESAIYGAGVYRGGPLGGWRGREELLRISFGSSILKKCSMPEHSFPASRRVGTRRPPLD